MATVTEMRSWLRDHGHDVPVRGRLEQRWITLYEEENPAADGAADDWDLPDDTDLGTIDAGEEEPSVPLTPERPPRTARAARAERRAQPVGQRTGRLLGALRGEQGGKKTGSKKKAPPRTSVEKFTSRLYSSLGRMIAPLSPATSNCLQAQAAMAGVILEDTVRGTFADRILQPAARAEDKLNKMAALVLPPVVVFAIEQNQAAVQMGAKTPQQGMVRHAMLMPALRESLRIGLEVSESYGDQIKARLEMNQRLDAEIDDLIGLIFGQVPGQAEDVPEPQMAGAAA
jgi:hypothetical protein